MGCPHGTMQKVYHIYPKDRYVILMCGHRKNWPKTYVDSVGQVRKLPMPTYGQITECHEGNCCTSCNEKDAPRVLTVYRRRAAEWSCT